MRTLRFTFRRRFEGPGGKEDKQYYGNSEETVESGPNKGEKVKCFEVVYDRAPSNVDELLQDIGNKFDKFVDTVYTAGIKERIKSEILLKLEPGSEKDPAVRQGVIDKVDRLVKEFSYNLVISEALTAKTAIDELNSPEMQELALSDYAEFTRRAQAILAATRGVKTAA